MSQEDGALVEEIKTELSEIDNAELSEHAHRFEALYEKLSNALNSIDGL